MTDQHEVHCCPRRRCPSLQRSASRRCSKFRSVHRSSAGSLRDETSTTHEGSVVSKTRTTPCVQICCNNYDTKAITKNLFLGGRWRGGEFLPSLSFIFHSLSSLFPSLSLPLKWSVKSSKVKMSTRAMCRV